MTPDEARDFLNSYLEGLQQKDWAYVLPRQDKAARLVGHLYPSTAFPVLDGSYFPTGYVATQKQIVQTALVDLEDDPTLLQEEPESSPWMQTANELEDLANSMPDHGWTGQATEAQQLVTYVNPEAAKQIGKLVEQYNFFGPSEMPTARAEVVAAIRGAARAARIHGALQRQESVPGTVVKVSQAVSQTMMSVAVSSINDLLTWDGLPEEVRPTLEAMKTASAQDDRAGLMKKASEFAEQASKFPLLMKRIGDAWEWIGSLL